MNLEKMNRKFRKEDLIVLNQYHPELKHIFQHQE